MDIKSKKSNSNLKFSLIIILLVCSVVSIFVFGIRAARQEAWRATDTDAFLRSWQYEYEFEKMAKKIEDVVYSPYVNRMKDSGGNIETSKAETIDKKEVEKSIKNGLSAWNHYKISYYIIDNNSGTVYKDNERYKSLEDFQKEFNKSDNKYSYALLSYPNSFIESKSPSYSTQETYATWNHLDPALREVIKPATVAIALEEEFPQGTYIATMQEEFYTELQMLLAGFFMSLAAFIVLLIFAKRYLDKHNIDFYINKKIAKNFNNIALEVRVTAVVVLMLLLRSSADFLSITLCLIAAYMLMCAIVYDRSNLLTKSFYNDVSELNSKKAVNMAFAQRINNKYRSMVLQGVVSYFACAVVIFISAITASPAFALVMLFIITVYFCLCMYKLYRYNVVQIKDIEQINDYTALLKNGEFDKKLFLTVGSPYLEIQNNLNAIGDSIKTSVEKQVASEKMKSELVTNVSHDLKTPLTSIITYVDLMKKENIRNKNAVEYLDILDKKSQKLKGLVEDVFDISKATSNSMNLNIAKINLKSIITQTVNEYEKEFAENKLGLKLDLQDDIYIESDGEKLGRMLENLIQNAVKYSLEGTNVYIDLLRGDTPGSPTSIIITNISSYEMDFTPEEIITRFTRADKARDLEGFGLGLSIVSSFADVLGIGFDVKIDKDLFKAYLNF